MPANYVLLEKVVVGAAGASSVTFNSIPQSGYTDLLIKYSVRVNRSGTTFTQMGIRVNGASTNYSTRTLSGNGSVAASSNNTTGYFGYESSSINSTNSTASTFSSGEIYIPNYTSSNYKSGSIDFVSENNATAANAVLSAALWSSTAAITSITFNEPNSNSNFDQHSTFSLYGVAALGTTPVIAPKATGGDIIQTDGTYWYHAFRSSGTFTPTQSLSCDMLIVAGGAGGSFDEAGGGGAGGLLGFNTQSLTAQAYTVTIGAGGTGGINASRKATNGSNTTFQGLTATVGGGAGADRKSVV